MSGTAASPSSSTRTTTGASSSTAIATRSNKTKRGTVVRTGASSNNSFFTNAIDFLTTTMSSKKKRITNATVVEVDGSNAPSWKDLERIATDLKKKHDIPETIDLEAGPTSPKCLKRTFGKTDEEIRVHFYRDHAGWCPYCETVWLLLEEKRIPYTVEKINMRCYRPPSRRRGCYTSAISRLYLGSISALSRPCCLSRVCVLCAVARAMAASDRRSGVA